jgi:hypothetical protein
MLTDISLRMRLLGFSTLVYAGVISLFSGQIGWLAYLICFLVLALLVVVLIIVAMLKTAIRLWGWAMRRTNGRAMREPMLLLLVVALTGPVYWTAGYVRDLVTIALVDKWMMAHVGQRKIDPADGPLGLRISIDRGPSTRVAFITEHVAFIPGLGLGNMDSWGAVVFDPAGTVKIADGRMHGEDHPASQLFGGMLVACQHVWGDYYRCTFNLRT